MSRKGYAYDDSCRFLAVSFLGDSTPPKGKSAADFERDQDDLAQEIQDLIEAFMNERGYQ